MGSNWTHRLPPRIGRLSVVLRPPHKSRVRHGSRVVVTFPNGNSSEGIAQVLEDGSVRVELPEGYIP